MKELQKKIISTGIIMLLLPYILTLFLNGQEVSSMNKIDSKNQVTAYIQDTATQLSFDEYLLGVLAYEIPLEYSYEAMKAQAVIIRSRLYKSMEEKEENVYQEKYLTGQEIVNKWKETSYSNIYKDLENAIKDTQDEVILLEDEIVLTPYHVQNIGTTREGNIALNSEEYSHLVSVDTPLDLSGINALTKVRLNYESIKEKANITEELTFSDIEIINKQEDGYVTEISVGGTILTGEEFRTCFNLSSTVISFQDIDEEQIQVTTRGSGHGLGLSQNTAHYMGLEGKTYEEILNYFYKDIEIKNKTFGVE